MFDWNEDEEVRDTIWGVLNEPEEHTVPYHKGSEDDTQCTFNVCSKKIRYEESSTNLSIKDQRKSEAKNDFPGSSLESNSNVRTNEELSASGFDMNPWPDLPCLNSAFGKGYIERNHLHSMSSKFINDCPRSSNMETVTENMVAELYDADAVLQSRDPSLKESCSLSVLGVTQLDREADIFVNEHEDNEGDSFLNCDWANITDFMDLDRMFRNDDSIFGHEIIGKADEILSPSLDADSNTAPSFPLPVDGQSGTERKPLENDKVADNSASIGMQSICQPQLNSGNCGTCDHPSDKVRRQKKLPKSRKKMEEKNRTNPTQKLSVSSTSNTSGIQQIGGLKVQIPLNSPSQSFQSTALCQHSKGGGPGYMGFIPGANPDLLPGFEYPMHAFPDMPMLSPAHPERKQNQPASQRVYPVSSKRRSNIQSKPPSMTPQEKIEKLRRRQQVQAMLAIQQQQQQFGQQSSTTQMSLSQTSSQNQSHGAAAYSEIVDETTKWLSSSEWNMPQEGDESQRIPTLFDDSLGETIFYQLQDAIGKLDVGVRLCIRDSLFRLARSAMERHNASDTSSTNKSSREEDDAFLNEETNSQDRSTRLPSETGTNPIDRIMAHLLFDWPSEPGVRPIKDEMPPTISSNPEQSNAYESISEGKPEKADMLEARACM